MEEELLWKLKQRKNDKLIWKPIKNCTYNLYITDKPKSILRVTMLGFRFYTNGYRHAGSYTYIKHSFHIEIGIFFCVINFWVQWGLYQDRQKIKEMEVMTPPT